MLPVALYNADSLASSTDSPDKVGGAYTRSKSRKASPRLNELRGWSEAISDSKYQMVPPRVKGLSGANSPYKVNSLPKSVVETVTGTPVLGSQPPQHPLTRTIAELDYIGPPKETSDDATEGN